MDRFAMLLADLGALIAVPLHPDHNRSCTLNIDGRIHVELKEEEDRILVGTFIAELPPGKFRENILIETLKENHLFPRLGTFGYSDRSNQLAIFAHLYYPGLRGDTLADYLEAFIEKTLSWKTAIETGQLPSIGQRVHKAGPSIFDVQRK